MEKKTNNKKFEVVSLREFCRLADENSRLCEMLNKMNRSQRMKKTYWQAMVLNSLTGWMLLYMTIASATKGKVL